MEILPGARSCAAAHALAQPVALTAPVNVSGLVFSIECSVSPVEDVGVWGVGCGVWGVGCGVWGVGCEVLGVGCEV